MVITANYFFNDYKKENLLMFYIILLVFILLIISVIGIVVIVMFIFINYLKNIKNNQLIKDMINDGLNV